jgi:hypothetical protein
MEFYYPRPDCIIDILVNAVLSSLNLNLLIANYPWRMKDLLWILRVMLKEQMLMSSNLKQHLACPMISWKPSPAQHIGK